MGEIFREPKESLLTMTLWKRLLACIKKLLLALAEPLGADPIMMLQELLNNKKIRKAKSGNYQCSKRVLFSESTR